MTSQTPDSPSTTGLAGTTALVTGASSGIGEAVAGALAARGALVALAARRRDRLTQVAENIRAKGGAALVVEADVSDEPGAEAAVAAAVAESGRLDIVVNNAGVLLLGPVEDAPTEEWRRMVELNLLGVALVSRAALPHLLRAAAPAPGTSPTSSTSAPSADGSPPPTPPSTTPPSSGSTPSASRCARRWRAVMYGSP